MKRPEIIHAHDTLVLPIASILTLVLRAKLIYDAHELESNKAGSSRIQSRLIFIFEKLCWPAVDGFITVSEGIRDWYRSHFGLPFGVVVLNSPVLEISSVPLLGKTRHSTVRNEIAAKPQQAICLYIGAFEPGRGIERLVEAFMKPGVKSALVLLGDGSLRTELLAQTETTENVHVLQPVKHNELVGYISDADYGFSIIENVSLSDYLCLPNKMFEYLNAGLTVICSDFPEMRNVVEGNGFGYAIGESEQALVEVIKNIDSKARPAKIERDRVSQYTWESQALKLQALYDSVKPN